MGIEPKRLFHLIFKDQGRRQLAQLLNDTNLSIDPIAIDHKVAFGFEFCNLLLAQRFETVRPIPNKAQFFFADFFFKFFKSALDTQLIFSPTRSVFYQAHLFLN